MNFTVRLGVLLALANYGLGKDCNELLTEYGRVCVCNETYCDTVPILAVPKDSYQLFTTSSEKLGYTTSTGPIEAVGHGIINNIKIIYKQKQTILGFGGSFTDSAGINIYALPEGAQEHLLNSYFGDEGISYSIARVPIGGTDFSTRPYTYDSDHDGDVDLEHFALQEEDILFKIPYIQKALQLTKNNLKLFASVWTAPPWMKTNNDYAGIGFLKEEHYQVWANYFIRFFEEYKNNDVDFWAVTTQNEPIDGFLPSFLSKINSMGWTTSKMSKWISENFGPTIRNSSFNHLKIIVHDDNRITLALLPAILENDEVVQWVDGVGLHWYEDWLLPDSLVENAKSSKKDLFLLGTEACNGYMYKMGLDKSVKLGSWNRAEDYINNIMKVNVDDINLGVGGWTDWNMILDEQGGPCYINNFVDAPIIVNNSTGEFYKQPMFYALGHFSKFLLPGSIVLDTDVTSEFAIKSVAVLRPDNLTAIIIFNEEEKEATVNINDEKGNVSVQIPAKSINTILL
ncbi:putative glucosylceramidase 4 [Aethina tumida]|uniref:putative glucosylceramidase 4 n=1 Tax=Aethina tumida TaxID=116153 RepID=UPI002148B39F|nr:putative glucosylceramidase 4 [Aethina tumida]